MPTIICFVSATCYKPTKFFINIKLQKREYSSPNCLALGGTFYCRIQVEEALICLRGHLKKCYNLFLYLYLFIYFILFILYLFVSYL